MANRFLIVCGGSGVGLLGQRRALRVDAELQVDVSGENVIRGRRVKDPNSFSVNLDQRIGATAVVFEEALRSIGLPPEQHSSVYVQRSLAYAADAAHTRFMAEYMPANRDLETGLAQSPAVGGATVRHQLNRDQLHDALGQMLNLGPVGPDDPVEVWIVASTAGGTGEGVHRFVGALLAHLLKQSSGGAETKLRLNFVRVGQLTYRKVQAKRTALNTFFGVAADAAMATNVQNDFPQAVANFFYMDLPDVGVGDRSKPVRAEIVEMAVKAIMLPEMHDDLQKLLVNDHGIPMVLARTGFWGKDFGDQRKFYETLRQLRVKLRDLIEPDYQQRYIEGNPLPQLVTAPALDDMVGRVQNARTLLARLEAGWQFPRYRLGGFPRDLGAIISLLRLWTNSMSELLGIDVEEPMLQFRVDRSTPTSDEPERRESVELAVPAAIEEGEDWFRGIDEAHRTRAWATFLLGCDPQDRSLRNEEGKLIKDLLGQAQEVSRVLRSWNPFWSSERRAQQAAALLGDFLFTLAQVNHLLGLEEVARGLLEREMLEPRRVLEVADEEFDIVRGAVGTAQSVSIEAAELSDLLDPLAEKTWLQLLRDAVRRADLEQFREEVLRGATGLTGSGLRAVLGLPPQADVVDIQRLLSTKMGHMLDSDDKPHEALWWASTPAEGTARFEYRILPRVDRQLEALLIGSTGADEVGYRYQFARMGTIGLYVLAVKCVSMTKEHGDTVSAPAFLMKPFVPDVQRALSNWRDQPVPREPSGQLEIVSAGVCGEPLYERALRAAGLNDEDIDKIGQFYRMFN